MLIIPAVDIRGGKAVRLIQGRGDKQVVYFDNPLDAALHWERLGAKRLHVVDLDGAFEGEPRNQAATISLIRAVRIEVEVGGGLRTERSVGAMLAAGAARCIIGTRAVEDRDFVADLAYVYPGRISVGVDARDGMVLTRGWVQAAPVKAVDLVAGFSEIPLAEVIYTDVDRDGMLQGPNIERIREFRDACRFPLIASGGVTTLADLRRLQGLKVFGCVIGKALYDGRLDLTECLALAGEGGQTT